MVITFGQTKGDILVNGLTTRCMGRASTHGLMAKNIKVQHAIDPRRSLCRRQEGRIRCLLVG
jgi:hypothetical protein